MLNRLCFCMIVPELAQLEGFAYTAMNSVYHAALTFVGQNMGARQMKRVEEGVRVGMKAGLAISVFLVAAILIFGEGLMRIFTQTEYIVNTGVRMMRILAVGYVAMAVTQSLSGVMRGAGDTMPPMWISLITTVIVRVPIAYLWAHLTKTPELPDGSPDSIYASLLISWVLGAVLSIIVYRMGRWREKGMLVGKA